MRAKGRPRPGEEAPAEGAEHGGVADLGGGDVEGAHAERADHDVARTDGVHSEHTPRFVQPTLQQAFDVRVARVGVVLLFFLYYLFRLNKLTDFQVESFAKKTRKMAS